MTLAVITGASAGVGRATARHFARQGVNLVLIARGKAGLEGTKRECERFGVTARTYPADVSDHKSIFSIAAEIDSEVAPIDIWVNNAMVSVFGPVSELSPEEFKRVTEVTYLGVVYGTMAALENMRPRNRGHVVQVGSALSYRGIPLQAPYCAAKHAVKGFTESLRSELLHDNSQIVVNMVQLPALNTPQFRWSRTKFDKAPQPVPPIFEPDLAAEAIYHAATHNVRQIILTGNTKVVIAGNKLLPALGDWYLAKSGYEDQLTDRDVAPDRPDNLWNPADDEEDFGADGPFIERARPRSLWWDVMKHFYR